jgi:hypothetical protein
MATDSFFALACASFIAIMFGLAMCFLGYRLFLFLLPIWGFFFGIWLGAQSMQALFGTGFLSTVTSWVVGFVVGLVFAVLSYLFYFLAVAVLAGSVGYFAAVGLLQAFGMELNWFVWLIGIVAAIALAFVTLRFNLQKWVIIIATAVAGAAVVFGSVYVMFNPHLQLLENPIQALLSYSPLLLVLTLALAVFGIVMQVRASRMYTIEEYNRWE